MEPDVTESVFRWQQRFMWLEVVPVPEQGERMQLPLCRGEKGIWKWIIIPEILITQFVCYIVELGTVD